MLSTTYNIAKNTFRETVREPVYLLIVMSALVLISFYPWFCLFAFRQQTKMVMDSAMATIMVLGWVIAVLTASRAISGEISRGTTLLLLAKPVPRPIFIMGKTLGIMIGLTLFWFLASITALLSLRIASDQFWIDNRIWAGFLGVLAFSCVIGGVCNFTKRISFPMATVVSMSIMLLLLAVVVYWLPGKGGSGEEGGPGGFAWQLMPALVLILYAIWAMGAMAVMLSTRFELINNMIICSVMFTLGLMSDYLLGRFADDFWLARIAYACLPNWQLFWMADALAANKVIPVAYVALGGVYVFLLIGILLFIANLMFWNREAGEQNQN